MDMEMRICNKEGGGTGCGNAEKGIVGEEEGALGKGA
jgi:hypothetical protein